MTENTFPVSQMYGLFNGAYYALDQLKRIVIPTDLEYKSPAIMPKMDANSKCAEVDIYQYHNDFVTDCNVERVKYMKEFLMDEEVTQIVNLNPNYSIEIEYTLYDKHGSIIKSGTAAMGAKSCMAMLADDIKVGDMMEYRYALVMDGRIILDIPPVASYGFWKCASQDPYTLRITSIKLYSNMNASSGMEDGSQLNDCDCGASPSHHNHAPIAGYHIHRNTLCGMNHNSCFITNAQQGTTIIDSVVASAVLKAPEIPDKIEMCSIDFENPITVKFSQPLKHIIVNLEVVMDNLVKVYDKSDIDNLLTNIINDLALKNNGGATLP